MTCDYTRKQIERIVVRVYRRIQKDNTITRFSRFGPGKEIDIDEFARQQYFFPIKQKIDREPDCVVTKLTPIKCQKAKTVGEIIDAICKEFDINGEV